MDAVDRLEVKLARVRSYTRRGRGGKTVHVREYTNKVTAALRGGRPTGTYTGPARATEPAQAAKWARVAERTSPPPSPPPRGGGQVQQVVRRLHAKATAAEPKLTALVSGLVEKRGGHMVSLHNALKDQSSLARKINADVVEFGKPPAEIGKRIFDTNRYTGVFADANYAASAKAVLDQLRSEGYKLRVKNFWQKADNPYQGINVQVTSPDGLQWELQFHTEESLKAKKTLHKTFEKQRVLEPGDPMIAEYAQQMHEVSKQIPVPPKIELVVAS